MNIIAVDDEESALWALERGIREAAPGTVLHCFSEAAGALAYAREHRVDVAFLDIEMHELDGLAMAKQLKEIHKATNIVFVTGHSSYMVNAFEMHASGYVMKPIRAERIAKELAHLRTPIVPQEQGVRIQCFGNFAVFVDGRPILFSRTKSKELLAYLVHKQGAALTNAEIAAVLWENKTDTRALRSNTRNVIARLIRSLKEEGIDDIICRTRNNTALDVDKVSCDYYDYLRGKMDAVNAYAGEYMSEYSWAEFTLAYLNQKK